MAGSKEVAAAIERKMCYPVDLGDNGIEPYNPTIPRSTSISFTVHCCCISVRHGKKGKYMIFDLLKWSRFVKRILEREIKMEQDKLEGQKIVHEIYWKTHDKQIIVIEGSTHGMRSCHNTQSLCML